MFITIRHLTSEKMIIFSDVESFSSKQVCDGSDIQISLQTRDRSDSRDFLVFSQILVHDEDGSASYDEYSLKIPMWIYKIVVKRYIWSAHLRDYKNFDQALQIMKALENTNINLDVYGGTREEFLNICELTNCYPRNVTYLGLVNDVPYQKYDGYISTSNHEMFSNACVEAMSHGLKCIVSNLEHPYQFYSSMTDNEVEIAHDTKEYIALMVSNSEKEFTSDSQFSFLKRYSYESWTPLFTELISER